jgi:hypothetical protein
MSRQPARQTFGLKNARTAPAVAAASLKTSARKGGGDVKINPLILAGGTVFIIGIAAVMMLGGQPQVVPGQGPAPQITELPAAAKPATAPASSGGKFGAASSAFQSGGAAR